MSETAHPGKVNPARKPNFIRSIEQRAYEAGFHPDTLRTQIANGEGPPVIRLSPKRLGIRDSDWNEWLDSRRIAPQEAEPADVRLAPPPEPEAKHRRRKLKSK